MFQYRLVYSIVLMSVISFYAVYTPWFSWYLLILVLLLPLIDIVISLPGMLSKSVRIDAPLFLEKDAHGILTITAVRDKPYPVRCLRLRLRVIGDDFALRCNVQAPASDIDSCEVVIDTSHTGLTVFIVHRLYAVSLMGLFSLRIKSKGKASVLVLPAAKKPVNSLGLPRSMAMQPKPGGGFSEEHDLRSYRPGDPVKSIHWKLSAKSDLLIMREALMPVPQRRLIHIMPWENAAERDSVLSHLRWASEFLLNMGLPYYVRFGDRQQIEEITSEDSLIDFLRRVLDNTAITVPGRYPRVTWFTWVYKISGE